MKIEKISDKSVRIILSNEDFAKQNLDIRSCQVDSPKVQRLIWDAIANAEAELGIHISARNLRISARAQEDNSLSIVVTDPIEKESNLDMGNIALEQSRELAESGKFVISFVNYDNLYTFFRNCPGFQVLASKLYTMNDAFYLVVSGTGKNKEVLKNLEVRLADSNALVLPADLFVPLLDEHGEIVFRNAGIKRILNSFGPDGLPGED